MLPVSDDHGIPGNSITASSQTIENQLSFVQGAAFTVATNESIVNRDEGVEPRGDGKGVEWINGEIHKRRDHRGESEPVNAGVEVAHARKEPEGVGRARGGGEEGEQGVEGDKIGVGDAVEEGRGEVGVERIARERREERVVGEDVWLRDFVEHLMGVMEKAAFRVKEDEVVGEVGGMGNAGLGVDGVEGGASGEVAAGDAGFQEISETEKVWA